ncbi:MAG: hypothetical protein H7A14_07430 [Sinobacteraceae bacterium]|nr:hypothetical protein [Nevskiaceae bacterium]MCP5360533.1 hypothetical protein [Nevskiaceae bacterium]
MTKIEEQETITNRSDRSTYLRGKSVQTIGTTSLLTKNGATITWYASNKPLSISYGTYTSTFNYTADDQYWRQTATYSNGTETTYYIGGLLEIVSNSTSGITAWRHPIKADGRTVAVYTRGSNGANNTIYPLTDHLGSTEAITDDYGAVVVRESFTAFGKRRGSAWTGAPTSGPGGDEEKIANSTRRGFTGHTMLDNLGLVHMNGRVHDPDLGRFLSGDPYIDGVLDTQGWNRYSYVQNNPLSRWDPAGYGAEGTKRDAPLPEVVITGRRPPSNPSLSLHGAYFGGSGGGMSGGRPDVSEAGGARRSSSPTPGGVPAPVGLGLQDGMNQSEGSGSGLSPERFDPMAAAAGIVSECLGSPTCVLSFVPVAGQLIGTYEAFLVATDPNASTADKVVAVFGILPNRKLAKIAGKAAGDVLGSAARATSVGATIEGQLAKRGWSRSSVDDAISNPTRTVATRDTRHLPGGGRNNDPATAYYSRDGGYVVRNDRTGDIVQVSNRNDPHWSAPWD